MVRVRIAPSPTGLPHIGTIWQALINFSYARKNQGQFIVRIEDTDQKRLVKGAEEALFKALAWFGLTPDESIVHGGELGPYRQSERLDLYKKYSQQLVDKGQAYCCFCSEEKLKQSREKMVKAGKPPMYDRCCRSLSEDEVAKKLANKEAYVVRLKVPDNEEIVVNDLIRGVVKFKSEVVDDQVLLKSNGFPTYHLALVVDDHLMKISHVVRGEEWLSSAPKHILLYRYFDWPAPIFIHTPILRNPDRSKLSKRQGQTNVSWYQESGYLPEAILNFLALLGWSHPKEKTIFSLKEFIEHFDLKDLSPVGPIVDLKKLTYLNAHYIRQKSDKELVQLIKPFIDPKVKDLLKIVPLIKERITTLKDAKAMTDFFVKLEDYDKELLLYKKADFNLIKQQLEMVLIALEKIQWSLENITKTMQDLCESNQWHRGQFFMALRVAVTGKKITPPLFESMEILGKKETLKRIQTATTLL